MLKSLQDSLDSRHLQENIVLDSWTQHIRQVTSVSNRNIAENKHFYKEEKQFKHLKSQVHNTFYQ